MATALRGGDRAPGHALSCAFAHIPSMRETPFPFGLNVISVRSLHATVWHSLRPCWLNSFHNACGLVS